MRRALIMVFMLVLASGQTANAGQAYRLKVDGLACPFCAYGIEKQLTALDGVQNVVVDLKAGVVQVTMKDGSSLGKIAAERAVKDAGFTLKGFESVPE